MPETTVLCPDYEFIQELESYGTFGAEACFQCRKCTNGCPVAFAMDVLPDQVIRMVLLGQREAVLSCNSIWLCISCETCTARCPNKIKIAELMDGLKEMAIQSGIACPQPQIRKLHETFLDNVRKRGRVFELGFIQKYMFKSGELRRKWNDGELSYDLKLGLKMAAKGRYLFRPSKINGKDEIREMLAYAFEKKNKP